MRSAVNLRRDANSKGLSLVEVMIAAALLGIGAVGISTMVASMARSKVQAKLVTEGDQLASLARKLMSSQAVMNATAKSIPELSDCIWRGAGSAGPRGCSANMVGRTLPFQLREVDGTSPLPISAPDFSTLLTADGKICIRSASAPLCRWSLSITYSTETAASQFASLIDVTVRISYVRPPAGSSPGADPNQLNYPVNLVETFTLPMSRFFNTPQTGGCLASQSLSGLKPDGSPNCVTRPAVNTCASGFVNGMDPITGSVLCSEGGVAAVRNCLGAYSGCTKPCGGGIQVYQVTQYAQFGGTPCAISPGTTLPCNTQICPIDCVGGFTPCTVACGGGLETFQVFSPAQGMGAPCGFTHGYTRACNLAPCPSPAPMPSGGP